jgi:multidrug efflux pump subunit AcrA (membrane-fusion protein)
MITGNITEITPQVQRRVIEVPVGVNEAVEPGDVLFQIDPRPYQYRIDQLKAQLVESEAYVAQLKESYDAARAQTKATRQSLAASVGGSSDLDDVIGSLGAGLFAPLFTGGALEAHVEAATADQEAAIAVYGQSLLQAFEEVETALTQVGAFYVPISIEGFLNPKNAVEETFADRLRIAAGLGYVANPKLDVQAGLHRPEVEKHHGRHVRDHRPHRPVQRDHHRQDQGPDLDPLMRFGTH